MPTNTAKIKIIVEGAPTARQQLEQLKQATDKVNKAGESYTKGAKNMRGVTAGLQRAFGRLRNQLLLVSFALGGVAAGVNRLVEVYRKQIEAETKLRRSLKNISGVSEDAADRLIDLAGAYQKTTTFGDEAIISAQAMLSTFQLNENAIAELTPRILDMAAATGQDLQSAAIMVGKAFTGQASAMSRAGVVIDEFGLKSARSRGPVDEFSFLVGELDKNFEGLASSLAETDLGKIDQFVARIGDMQEKMGEASLPAKLLFEEVKFFFVEQVGELQIVIDSIRNNSSDIELAFEKASKRIKEFRAANRGEANDVDKLTYRQIIHAKAIDDLVAKRGSLLQQMRDEDGVRERAKAAGVTIAAQRAREALDIAKIVAEINRLIKAKEALTQAEDPQGPDAQVVIGLKERIALLREEMGIRNLLNKGIKESYEFNAEMDNEEISKLLNRNELQKQLADVQREIDLQKQEIDLATQETGKATTEQQEKFIKTRFKQVELEEKIAQANAKATSTMLGSFASLNDAAGGRAKVSARLAQIAATIDMFAGANKAFAQGGIFGFATAASIIAAGTANIVQINKQMANMNKAALGADFVTDGPQMLLVGEQGRERVNVTPLEGPNVMGGGESGNVVFNISGNVLSDDFVMDKILPKIEDAAGMNLA